MAQLLTGTRIYGTGTVDTQLFVSGTNSATSTTTGALQVVGGVGVGGNLHVGGIIYGAILGTATTATNADNVKTVLQVSSATYYPTFVDANNSTAAYEAVYTTSSFVINPSTGFTAIGTSAAFPPDAPLTIAPMGYINTTTVTDTFIHLAGDTTKRRLLIDSTSPSGPVILGRQANGTQLLPTATSASNILLFIDAAGFNGVGYNAFSAMIQMIAAENFTATAAGSYITFGTTPLQTVGTVERMRIDSSGTVGIGFTAPNGKLDVAGDLYVGATQNTARFKSDNTNTFVDAIPGAGAVVIRAGGSIEKLRVTANGGISFGASGTAYGVSGQILQSNGDAAPTWISTGSLAAANATTATHLSGGVAGQIPYQTAPGVTSFLSTGTAGDVLVSNGSSAATYNNTLRLAGATNATSTSSGALQVVGGVGVGGDLFIQGDIRTNDTLFNLINGNATTVNFAGDATALTMGASGSGTTNVRNNLTVNGNLTVQGTTTIVDSTVTNIADPIITLGGGTGNTAPTADDNKDRGVAFKYVNNAGTTSTGFFGYDDSTGYLTYVPSATITNEVVSGTKGAMDVNLAGGTAMSIHYQSAADTTAFLAASTSGYLLQTNGTGSAPTWVSASGVSAGSATYADSIRTIAQTASASYYPTFVDSNNASNTYELVYTTSSFSINPQSGLVTISGLTVNGVSSLNGRTTVKDTINADTSYPLGIQNGSQQPWWLRALTTSNKFTLHLNGTGDLVTVDTTGNVGIGTISPNRKLHVQSSGAAIQLWDASTNGGAGIFFAGASTLKNWFIGNQYNVSDVLEFTPSAAVGTTTIGTTPVMVIQSGGNVGIGTSTPQTTLDVRSYTTSNTTVTNGVTLWNPSGVNDTPIGIRLSTYGDETGNQYPKQFIGAIRDGAFGAGKGSIVFCNRNAADTSVVTLSDEKLRITANGGIAFGGAANYGSSGFVLKSNGDAAPTWVDPSTLASASATNADNIRTIAQTASASYYPTFVDSNNSTAAYESVYTTGTFVINPATGYIGMGTASPGRPLHVVSIGTATQGIAAFEANSSGLVIQTNSGQNGNVEIVGYKQSSSTYHNILLRGSSSGLLVQNTTGNVGIGNLTPIAKLHIGAEIEPNMSSQSLFVQGSKTGYAGFKGLPQGQLLIYDDTASTAGAGGAIGFGANTGASQRTWIASINSERDSATNDATNYGGSLVFYTRPAQATPEERVRITSTGNVGIGTSSPGAKLEVSTAAITNATAILVGPSSGTATLGDKIVLGFKLQNTAGGGTGNTYAAGIAGVVDAAASNSGALAFYTQTSAGDGTPERMRITRNGGISFGASGTAYGTSGQVLQSNGDAAPTWVAQSTIAAGSAPLTNTYVGFGSGSNLLTGSANLTYASSILNVAYQNTFDASTPGFGTYGLHFNGQTTAGSATGITFSAGAASATNANAGIYSQGSGSYGTKMYFATTDSYAVGSKTRVMIDQAGNVGIGTVNPSAKLEIGPGWSSGAGLKINYGNSSGTIEAVNFISNGGTNGVIGMQMVSAGVGDLWLGGSGGRTLTLYRDGNVGINSIAPASKLTVEGSGTANESVARFNNQGDYASRIWLRQSSRSAYLSVSGSTGDTLATGSLPYGLLIGLSGNPSPVQFYNGTSGAVKMTIDTVGNVGIGTTSTTNKFEVAGTAGQLFSVSDSFTGTIFSVNDVSGIPSIEVLDTGLVKMAQYNGAVTIGTGTVSSSTAELSVYGMLYTSGAQGEIRASSEITAYFSSDRRLKENIKLIENPITIIDQIRGVTFDWTDEHMARRGGEDGYFVRKHDIGVIAQEVQAVLPELVGTREDGYLAVKYEKMVPLLIEAIKSQQKTIDTLTSEIKEIKEFLSSLKNN